jgi:long-chain acyl-CoA synthetase
MGKADDRQRPWHRAWPAHVPRSLEYPRVPAWWLLERNLPRFGRREAIRELDGGTLDESRRLTYEELWRAVRGVASGLSEHDLGQGLRVGLCLPNGAPSIVGCHATWYAGGVVVPANPAAPASELTQQLGEAEVTLIVGAAASAAERAAEDLGVPFIDVTALRAMETLPVGGPGDYRSDQDVAVLLYTAGTTGAPKAAMLTHRSIVASTVQCSEWYAFVPGDEVSFCALPTFRSGGLSAAMNVPLSAGATLLMAPPFVARAVGRHRVTRLFGEPALFAELVNDESARAADYASLRACGTNGAALPPSVKQAFDSLAGREVLIEGYGLAETGALTHANPVGRAKAGSIGIPLPDTDARIVGPQSGADVTAGQPGELWVQGPQVMRGYWLQEEETGRALSDGWLATGDVATMDDEGYFTIVDRRTAAPLA